MYKDMPHEEAIRRIKDSHTFHDKAAEQAFNRVNKGYDDWAEEMRYRSNQASADTLKWVLGLFGEQPDGQYSDLPSEL